MDLELLKELSKKTLKSYRKKAKPDSHRWISRSLAKAKYKGGTWDSWAGHIPARVGSTERESLLKKFNLRRN